MLLFRLNSLESNLRKSRNESRLIKTVGLEHRETHFPSQLSGGEQQPVAFVRALAKDPDLILADKPTGNLDVKNAEKILQVLKMLKVEGKTVIVSTHDLQIRELADKVFCLKDSRLAMSSGAGFPVNYLLRRRLQTSLTITTLHNECGFNTVSVIV